jgi:HK97 family phage portal protein
MGYWRNLKNAFLGVDEKAAKTPLNLTPTSDANRLNEAILQVIGSGLQTMSDDARTYVSKGYADNHDVYSIVNRIARSASVIPWSVYELRDKKAQKRYVAAMHAKEYGLAAEFHVKAWEMIEHRDISPILEKPNELQSLSEFIEENIGYQLITGNAYAYKLIPTGFTIPSQLFNLPAHFVTIKLEQGTDYFNTADRKYVLNFNQSVEFLGNEVYHRKYWNPAIREQDFIYGLSPLRAAKRLVQRSNDGIDASTELMQNRGIRGIVSQGTTKDEDGGFLTPEESKRLQAKFDEKTMGKGKFGKIFATSAAINWQDIGLSAVDLNIIESEKWDLTGLCNVYGVPVQLMNSTESTTYNNMQEAKATLYSDTIIPQLDSLRRMLNESISVPASKKNGRELYIDYDLRAIPSLQESLTKQSERYRKEFELGLLTGAQYRILAGHDMSEINDPDLNVHWTPNKLKPKQDGNTK